MPHATPARANVFADVERHGNGDDFSRVDSLSMDPAVFEKLFLNPQTAVKHDLAKTFAIPTPLALVGIGIALTPLSCCLMGWRGSNQQKLGAADIGAYLWFGGFSVIASAVMEFILGNTFSFVLFMGYGSWFLTYGATLQPFYNAAGAYAADAYNVPPLANLTEATAQDWGQLSPQFHASFGFIVVFMAVFSLIMLICSIRVNVVLVLLLLSIFLGFVLIAASIFVESESLALLTESLTIVSKGGDLAQAELLALAGASKGELSLKLVTGGGGALFAASLLNWYLLVAVLLLAVDFPILIGVYDLSTIVPGRSEIEAGRRNKKED